MFNENHFYPNHRKILINWLHKFKKLGFSYLALEALGAGQDSVLNEGYPPTIHTGFYTKDPHFAELIRVAQSLGFTFVSYENTNSEKIVKEDKHQIYLIKHSPKMTMLVY